MTILIDNVSDDGSWRREMLAQPLSKSDLRVIISELEHALRVEREKNKALLAEIEHLTSG